MPILCGVAAGIIVMRIYPFGVRALGWLAARRRDFVPVVGLRSVARRPASANLPLVVLMLAAAFGAFASVVQASIDHGQVEASYRAVGADFRLQRIGVGGLPATFDPESIAGVSAAASGLVDHDVAFANDAGQRSAIDLEMIDAAAYAEVTEGTAADPAWPRGFVTVASGNLTGSPSNPLPAIVSPEFLPRIAAALGVGDTFTIVVGQQPLTLRLVGRQAGVPGLGNPTNFVIVPLDWIRQALPDASFTPSVMWLRAPATARTPIEEMAMASPSAIRIVTRDDAYALLHDAPLGSAVADGFGVGLAIAVVYLAITLVGAVVMSAAGRTRDVAYLRTLGLTSRQALALTAVEHVPPVLLALVPGIVLGVVVAALVGPSLGLGYFAGVPDARLFVNWLNLGLMVIGLSLIAVTAIAAGSWLAGRARLAGALRMGDS